MRADATTPRKTLTLLALVRSDVQAVVSRSDGRASNVDRVSAGSGATAFNMGAVTGTTLTALGPSNRVLSELRLRVPRT